MDPATLSAIFLFCDSDHNILKKEENLYMSGHVLQLKNKCTTASFWKCSSFPRESFFVMLRFLF